MKNGVAFNKKTMKVLSWFCHFFKETAFCPKRCYKIGLLHYQFTAKSSTGFFEAYQINSFN